MTSSGRSNISSRDVAVGKHLTRLFEGWINRSGEPLVASAWLAAPRMDFALRARLTPGPPPVIRRGQTAEKARVGDAMGRDAVRDRARCWTGDHA